MDSEKTLPWPPLGKDPVGPGVQARVAGCFQEEHQHFIPFFSQVIRSFLPQPC